MEHKANDLTERLRAFGADMDGALARFAGDEALYAECFEMLLEDPSFASLDRLLKSGDFPEALCAAHALKGGTGNLGLTALYQAICSLVESLREAEHSDLEERYQTLLREKAALEGFR